MRYRFLLIVICFVILFVAVLRMESTSASKTTLASIVPLAEATNNTVISSLSPLVSICCLGIKKNIQSSSSDNLPLIAKAWFIACCLALLGIIVFKDIIGDMYIPLKKPLDALDVVQNTVMGIVVAAYGVPGGAAVFQHVVGDMAAILSFEVTSAAAQTLGTVRAPIGLDVMSWVIAYGLGLSMFYVTWSASHVVNVLTLLAPVPFVGVVLKTLRLIVLTILVGVSALNPYLGLLCSGLVLLFAIKVTRWATRFMVFGCVVALDTLGRKWRRPFPSGPVAAFIMSSVENLPRRVYGTIERDNSGLVFLHRPFGLLPKRRMAMGPGCIDWELRRGLLCPTISRVSQGRVRTCFVLPPRYRTYERAVADRCGIPLETRENERSIGAAWRWITEQFPWRTRRAVKSV